MKILGVLCGIWAFFPLAYAVRKIIREKQIKLISLANIMYAFVYGVLPAIVLFRQAMGTSERDLDTSNEGILQLALVLVLSVIGFFALNLGYRATKVRIKPAVTSEKVALYGGWVMLAIGAGSFFLWTRAAGGVMEFIELAPAIRGGWATFENPFAFLQNVTRILMLAACIMVSYWLQHIKKFWMIVPAAAALYGAMLFAMAWDSRVAFGFIFLTILLVYVEYRVSVRKASMRRSLVMVGVIAVGLLLLIVASEAIMSNFRGLELEQEETAGLFSIIEGEFGFVLSSQQRVMEAMFQFDYELQLFEDLLNAVTSWLPSRLIPFALPKTLWDYNTDVLFSYGGGQIPTDLVSSSILYLGVLGVLVIPFVYGWMLKKADGALASEKYNFYRSAIKGVLATVVINSISHFSFSMMAETLFYVVLGHVVVACLRVFLGEKDKINVTK